jgi:hypothetical protein
MTSLRYGRLTPRRVAGAIRRRIRRRMASMHKPAKPEPLPPFPALKDTPVVLGIGPANFAGQAWEWKRAVEQYLDGVSGEVFAIAGGLGFPADRVIEGRWYSVRAWQDRQEERILHEYTHLLAEAVRPVFGLKYGDTLAADLPTLKAAGLPVAILLHGSEIRRPDRHAERNPHSPFRHRDWELAKVLQDQSVRLGRIVAAFEGPKFVSTPDLLDDVPDATWLPVVVDPVVWRSDRPVMERARPVVLHVPSAERMKGSELIDPTVEKLAADGLVEYRRLSGVTPDAMPAMVADADIVLDQFALGSFGVAAVQSMCAGRVTVGHVMPHVRARVGVELPIVQATADTLRAVLLDLLENREAAREVAAAGHRYAIDVHDGRKSAEVLASFLQRPMSVPGRVAQ